MIDPVIDVAVRGALALLFAAAAWHKLSDLTRFGATLSAYQLLPTWAAWPTARLMPIVEALVAAGLLFPATKTAAALAGACLLGAYSAAITVNILRGRHEIDCGCFASSTRVPLSAGLLLRNTLLIGATGIAALPTSARPLSWLDSFTILAALLGLSLLWTATQRLAQTGPALRRAGGSS
jgi:hypothetical protein